MWWCGISGPLSPPVTADSGRFEGYLTEEPHIAGLLDWIKHPERFVDSTLRQESMRPGYIETWFVAAGCAHALVLLSSCFAPQHSSGFKASIHVMVDVSLAMVRTGDSILVVTRVINQTSSPITLETNPCPRRFGVMTAQGKVLELRAEHCVALSAPRVLRSGDEWRFRSFWNLADDLGMVPAGHYKVVGLPYGFAGPRSLPRDVRVTN